MSQLKLQELSHDQDQQLNKFDLQELRDGFFDPIYTKPAKLGDSRGSMHSDKRRNFSITKGLFLDSIDQISLDAKYQALKALRHWKIITKFTLAYFIAMLLCLIDKSGNWFGHHREWLPIATLINHPVHSIGAQLEITIQSIVGICLGLGWSSLALYISTATQPTRNHQGGILAGSLFIGLFFMGWFKAFYIRFYYMLLSSGLVLIFLSSNLQLDNAAIAWRNCWDIGIPYLFGLLISLFVSIIYIPYLGHEKMTNAILRSTSSIRDLLQVFITIDNDSDSETVANLQKIMIEQTLILSEDFREFLSGSKLSLFHDEDLKRIRNQINFIVSPLRVIPTPTIIYFNKGVGTTKDNNMVDTDDVTPETISGYATPQPKPKGLGSFKLNSDVVYISIMKDAFNEPLFNLIFQMVKQIDHIETTIKTVGWLSSSSPKKGELVLKLEEAKLILKKRVHQIDAAYRRFAKSEYFNGDLLNEEAVINIFLFLRYSRQAAVMIMDLTETLITATEKIHGWKVYLPNYPLRRALRRLPEQCLRDQGADSVYHYFETKIDVDDAFERIYNLNTSRIKNQNERNAQTVRAIDHHDFNFHSTKNPLRFKLWELISALRDIETKYAFKVSFVILFLALPAWLEVSWYWYYTYRCYWCPILVYFFLSPRNSSTWANLSTRLICWFFGCFWGWAANQAHHFKNGVVIGVFAVLISLVFSYGFLVERHPRSSFIALLSFTIVALDVKTLAQSTSASIWHQTWPVSLAILVSIFTTVFTNWLIWPFSSKRELYRACHSLLQHIGQSYQSVSERYLYRDKDDDPTDLTLELANIREVRMSQSLQAVKLLLPRAIHEHDITHSFKPAVFELLLNSCDRVLEKIIEARMSGIYVKVWEQDEDEATTQALLSYRRDSVTTVIYLLYVLSNTFLSKKPIPKYLPSSIMIRKEMYDMIADQESKRYTSNIMNGITQRLTEVNTSEKDDVSYQKAHWTEVHTMAFSRAFTTITEELENIVHFSKEILGEEDMFR
jgi:hypothetical protein